MTPFVSTPHTLRPPRSYGPLAWINGGFDTALPGDLNTKDGVDIRLGGAPAFLAVRCVRQQPGWVAHRMVLPPQRPQCPQRRFWTTGVADGCALLPLPACPWLPCRRGRPVEGAGLDRGAARGHSQRGLWRRRGEPDQDCGGPAGAGPDLVGLRGEWGGAGRGGGDRRHMRAPACRAVGVGMGAAASARCQHPPGSCACPLAVLARRW